MTKLTLSVDEETVARAKPIAEANNTSVSAMFSQFVNSLSTKPARRPKVGPTTRKVSGIIKLPKGKEDKELPADALMAKYGIIE